LDFERSEKPAGPSPWKGEVNPRRTARKITKGLPVFSGSLFLFGDSGVRTPEGFDKSDEQDLNFERSEKPEGLKSCGRMSSIPVSQKTTKGLPVFSGSLFLFGDSGVRTPEGFDKSDEQDLNFERSEKSKGFKPFGRASSSPWNRQ